MSRTSQRELETLCRRLGLPAASVGLTSKGHLQIRSNGTLVSTTSGTRGNLFTKKQLEADIKRWLRVHSVNKP